jgi:hypothetical protein
MQPMTGRERFSSMLSFGAVDRGFNFELALWVQTDERWLEEGLPDDVTINRSLMHGSAFFGLDRVEYLPLRIIEMFPHFTEETLEENERYRVMRFADGHITKALKEGESGGMRMSMDQYLSFPVTDRASWEDVKPRYRAQSPARYPEWWADVVRWLAGRDYPLALTPNGCFGLYSFMRRLMGTELACTIFYDDPPLAEEILEYLTDYFMCVIDRALQDVQVDFFNYFEDFAYNAGPLVGPNIVKRYFVPRYRRINDLLRAHGVRHIWLDSDGNPEVLIPHLLETGVTCLWPLERASNMDPLAIRARYGHDLALVGGIDKRALARDRKAIDEELHRHVPQLLEDGGYIPTVDHAIPPDISYDNWMYYLEAKRKLLGY